MNVGFGKLDAEDVQGFVWVQDRCGYRDAVLSLGFGPGNDVQLLQGQGRVLFGAACNGKDEGQCCDNAELSAQEQAVSVPGTRGSVKENSLPLPGVDLTHMEPP